MEAKVREWVRSWRQCNGSARTRVSDIEGATKHRYRSGYQTGRRMPVLKEDAIS
jgi:hypothetical protein